MGRIRVLDEHVANRIAAGEVVERPASVVKELVENSLDAGAKAIEIAVAAGGKRRIQVKDDGSGMDRDDALLSLERHATSKLARFEDLDSIGTLGFRGEALPSIASVSRFLLRTAREDGIGTEVEARAGRIQAVREVGIPRGTLVEANALFFNVPVRRKFLKSDATELSRVVRVVTHCAIAHPEVRFRLEHEGRQLLDLAPAPDLARRVAQVYGDRHLERLLPFAMERGRSRATGFVGRPVDAVQRRDSQHFFVNGRPVEDRVLSHAVSQALENVVARGLYLPLLLFLEIEGSEVDINAHPRKTEVRFTRVAEMHDLVRDAVASSLPAGAAVPSLEELRPTAFSAPPLGSIGAAALRYLDANEKRWSYVAGSTETPDRFDARGSDAPRPSASVSPEPSDLFDAGPNGGHAVALAQLKDSYILAQVADGLLVIDQHVAHERVLFERYLAEADENRVSVQKLLIPLTIDLDPAEAILLEEEAPELLRLGFLIEPFGGNSARLDGVPSFAATHDPAALLRAVLGDAARIRSTLTGVGEVRRRLVTTAACHAAIKVNHPLTREGMQRLLDDLFQTANPTSCPHGRPILFRVTMEEIERAFRRR